MEGFIKLKVAKHEELMINVNHLVYYEPVEYNVPDGIHRGSSIMLVGNHRIEVWENVSEINSKISDLKKSN